MRYDRPVRELLVECCDEMPEPFTMADVLVWFDAHRPDVAVNTVRTQFHTLVGNGQLAVVRDGRGSYRHTTSSTAAPTPENSAPAASRTATGHVVLLGCVKTKAPTPQPARSFYLSPLWQRSRAYAEASGHPWFVLSAKWGVIDPDEVVAPYDVALKDASRAYRSAWGEFVAQQLATRFSLRDLVVEVHAGDPYVDAVRGPLTRLGATVVDPVDATSMGATLAWYATPRDGHRPEPTAATDLSELTARALDVLGRQSSVRGAAELLASPPPFIDKPGLYTWWVDEPGAADLERGLGLPVSPGLLYAGQAGATRPGGRSSDGTLWSRIVAMHLDGTRRFSTLRFSLGVALDASFGVVGDEDALSHWMRQRLGVAVWPAEDVHTLAVVEERVLAALDPPFNLRGMAPSPVRLRLSELRHSMGR